jgi:hypothetical protein
MLTDKRSGFGLSVAAGTAPPPHRLCGRRVTSSVQLSSHTNDARLSRLASRLTPPATPDRTTPHVPANPGTSLQAAVEPGAEHSLAHRPPDITNCPPLPRSTGNLPSLPPPLPRSLAAPVSLDTLRDLACFALCFYFHLPPCQAPTPAEPPPSLPNTEPGESFRDFQPLFSLSRCLGTPQLRTDPRSLTALVARRKMASPLPPRPHRLTCA